MSAFVEVASIYYVLPLRGIEWLHTSHLLEHVLDSVRAYCSLSKWILLIQFETTDIRTQKQTTRLV